MFFKREKAVIDPFPEVPAVRQRRVTFTMLHGIVVSVDTDMPIVQLSWYRRHRETITFTPSTLGNTAMVIYMPDVQVIQSVSELPEES